MNIFDGHSLHHANDVTLEEIILGNPRKSFTGELISREIWLDLFYIKSWNVTAKQFGYLLCTRGTRGGAVG